MDEQKRQIFEALRRNRNAVYMGSVPPATKKQFIQFAEDEFLGNYGFALKWLLDNAFNDWKYEELSARIAMIENREKPREIKLLSGKKIRVKK